MSVCGGVSRFSLGEGAGVGGCVGWRKKSFSLSLPSDKNISTTFPIFLSHTKDQYGRVETSVLMKKLVIVLPTHS